MSPPISPKKKKRASHQWNDLSTCSLTANTLFHCVNQAPWLVVSLSTLLLPNMLTLVKMTPVDAYTVFLKIQNLCFAVIFSCYFTYSVFGGIPALLIVQDGNETGQGVSC